MNFRTTGVILVVFALLLGVWYFGIRHQTSTKTETKPKLGEHYDVVQDDVQKVAIHYRDPAFTPLTLVKKGDDWQIDEPFRADADDDKVRELLRDLLEKNIKRTLDSPKALETYGLADPSITVTLWTTGEAPAATFLVGDKTVNYSAYVKEQNASVVHTVESSILDDLTRSPTDMRQRKLLAFDRDEVEAIRLIPPKGSAIRVRRLEEDRWQLEEPLQAPADAEEVRKLLDALGSLKAETFEADQIADADRGRYGLPGFTVEITLKQRTHRVQLGKAIPDADRLYVAVDDRKSVYGVDASLRERLERTAFDLRDKRLLDFQRFEVRRFEIEGGPETVVCEKSKEGTWEIRQPRALKADSTAVEDFLFDLDALQAVAFVEETADHLARYGLEPAQATIRLFVGESESPVLLRLGKKKGDRVYAYGNRPFVAFVSQDILQYVREGAAALRDKNLWSFETSDVQRFTLTYEDVRIECTKQGTTWQITHPVQEKANLSAVQGLLGKVTRLRVKRYQRQAQATGLEQPRLRLRFQLANGEEHTLGLGESAGADTIYARADDDPMVLVVDQSLLDDLRKRVEDLREKAL